MLHLAGLARSPRLGACRRHMSRGRGLTLVELMVASIIGVIVMLPVGFMLVQMTKGVRDTTQVTVAQREASSVLQFVREELEQASSFTILAGGTRINYTYPDFTNPGSGVTQNRALVFQLSQRVLRRQIATGPVETLFNDVDSLTFQDLGGGQGILVVVQARSGQGGVNAIQKTMRTVVLLRNF